MNAKQAENRSHHPAGTVMRPLFDEDFRLGNVGAATNISGD